MATSWLSGDNYGGEGVKAYRYEGPPLARRARSRMLLAALGCWQPLVSAAVPPPGDLAIVDMFTANDEIDMMRYRLRLHQPLALRTIILESNMTHSGHPKPLHMRNALTAEEIE